MSIGAAKGFIRSRLTMRCDIQRRGAEVEDAGGDLNRGDYADYLTAQPCKWWTEIGRGEVFEANRDAVIDTARILVTGDQDVVESDRILNITDRRGSVIDAGPWEIDSITPRPYESAKLLLLTRIR